MTTDQQLAELQRQLETVTKERDDLRKADKAKQQGSFETWASLYVQRAQLIRDQDELLKERDTLRAEVEKLRKERKFPMQNGPAIPWLLAELLYVGYSACYGTDQTLERIAQRGGFGWGEIEQFWTHSRGFRDAITAALGEETE